MLSNKWVFSNTPLAAQFKAQPPEIHKLVLPATFFAVTANLQKISSVIDCIAKARFLWDVVISSPTFRLLIPNNLSHFLSLTILSEYMKEKYFVLSTIPPSSWISTRLSLVILTKRFVSSESLLPYGANPMTLYSSEFTLNPKKYVKAEYNSPMEFG